MGSLTLVDWVSTAPGWQLEAERKACLKRIEDLWSDPDLSLARDRYDRHDAQVDLIRRIDARLNADAAGGV